MSYRDPLPEDLKDPVFNLIWQAIKKWDVNVPDQYAGYCGSTGNHVMVILDVIRPHFKHLEQAADRMAEACWSVSSKLESQMTRNPDLPSAYKEILRKGYDSIRSYQSLRAGQEKK